MIFALREDFQGDRLRVFNRFLTENHGFELSPFVKGFVPERAIA